MKKLLQKILAFFHIPWDKFLHFIVCCGAAVLSSIPSFFFMDKWQCVYSSFLFPIGLGLGKEYGDSKASGNKWSWGDVVADVLGVIVGSLLVLLTYSIIKKR